MTLTFISTSNSVAGIAYTPTATFDELLLAAGVTFGSNNSDFVDSSLDGLSLNFMGHAFATGPAVLELAGDGTNVYVGAQGSVTHFQTNPGNAAMFFTGEGTIVDNYGAIVSQNGIGILTRNSGGDAGDGSIEISNFGTITALNPVRFLDQLDIAPSTLVNGGILQATNVDGSALEIRGHSVAASDAVVTITNLADGVITASSEGRSGIFLEERSGGTRVENYGEINALRGSGVDASNISAGPTGLLLLNDGMIRGGNDIAVAGSDFSDTVINTGELIGSVTLGDDADIYLGRGGTINGVVFGGDGDDTFYVDNDLTQIIEGAGEGIDSVFSIGGYEMPDNIENLALELSGNTRGVGNDLANEIRGSSGDNRISGSIGNDTLNGNQGDDTLFGGANDDSMSGGEGDDHLSSGSGNDTVLGDDGEDLLLGRRGADSLNGGNGADTLMGGIADDSLVGGRGADVLIGGEGADKMNGGAGIDTFVWLAPGESLVTAKDEINGYEAGLDRLDLTAVMPDSFDINIGAGFTGGGTASVRTFETVGGDTRVFVDIDGDNTSDMRFDIVGVTGVTAVDFVI